MQYIYNKDSFDNSIEVENYPWGFKLKTKKRFWIETNKRGSRFVSCTLDPKTNKWCKPKASTYNNVAVLCSEIKDNKNFISYIQLDEFANDADIVKFTRTIEVDKLPILAQKQICFLKAKNHAWKGVKVEFVTNPTPEQSAKIEANDLKAKKYLALKGAAAYNNCLIKNNLKRA